MAHAEAAFTPEGLWPNGAADLEGEPDRGPYRGLYLGAAGVLFALDELSARALLTSAATTARPPLACTRPTSRSTTFPELSPALVPGLLDGEAGILLVADRLAPSVEIRERLLACVRENARNPTNEPM